MGNCGKKDVEKMARGRINARQFKRQNKFGEPMRDLLTEKCGGGEELH
jgi:hypothetical protein